MQAAAWKLRRKRVQCVAKVVCERQVCKQGKLARSASLGQGGAELWQATNPPCCAMGVLPVTTSCFPTCSIASAISRQQMSLAQMHNQCLGKNLGSRTIFSIWRSFWARDRLRSSASR
eukprot:2144944-Rhodomonas_salina.2